MTKKFWADWQKRFGETESIYMKYTDDENGKGNEEIFKVCLYIILHFIFASVKGVMSISPSAGALNTLVNGIPVIGYFAPVAPL